MTTQTRANDIPRAKAACAFSSIDPSSQRSLIWEAAKVVNVHIHQFKPGGAVVDAGALAQFQEQWAT